MKIVIVIPTYNEKGNISKLITILEKEVFPKVKGHKMAILVVDDRSPDNTAEEVRDRMKEWQNIELISDEKKGLGAAYIRGMKYAIDKMDADVLFGIDADLSHDPRKIPEFIKKIEEGYDMVVGTRYSGGGSIPKNWGIQRKMFSVVGNMMVRTILMRFFVHDWTGGYRGLKKEVFLKEVNKLKQFKGYTFQVAFLHKAIQDGFKIAEVPIHFTDRTLGRSKIAPTEYITNLLKYIITARIIELIHSPFLKYAITGFIGYIINALTLELFSQRFGLHPGVAAMLGAECSIIWNFIINNFWAFNEHKITSPWKVLLKFPQFNLVSVGSLGIITAVVFLATHIFGDTILVRQISLAIAIGVFVIPYSYSMYNIFIWKRWHISFLSKLQEKVG